MVSGGILTKVVELIITRSTKGMDEATSIRSELRADNAALRLKIDSLTADAVACKAALADALARLTVAEAKIAEMEEHMHDRGTA